MPSSLDKFRLNGKELSLKVSNRVKVINLIQGLKYRDLLFRQDIATRLNISYDDKSFVRIPADLRLRLADRRVVYGSAATIKALRKELSNANN